VHDADAAIVEPADARTRVATIIAIPAATIRKKLNLAI
jgi:hypothetical protein